MTGRMENLQQGGVQRWKGGAVMADALDRAHGLFSRPLLHFTKRTNSEKAHSSWLKVNQPQTTCDGLDEV